MAQAPVTPPVEDTGRAARPFHGRRSVIRGSLLTLAGILGLAVLLIAQPYSVTGDSMEPTIDSGQILIAARLSPRLLPVHRGALVLARDPRTGQTLIKRVVATAGDTLAIEDGVLVLNGRPRHEAYVDYPTVDSVYYGPVTVPPGCYFLLGDNRADSQDSRDFGPIPASAVTGRVLTPLWHLGSAA